MKIGHTFYEKKGFGGSETFLKILQQHSRDTHIPEYVSEDLQFNETSSNFHQGFRRLVERLQQEEYNIIHNHFFMPALFCQQREMPYILTSHCMLSEEFGWSVHDQETDEEKEKMKISAELFDKAEREAYPQLGRVYVFSNFHRREIERIGGEAEKIPIIVDTESFGEKPKEDARKTLGMEDKFTLLFLGRPTYYKGLHTLLEAFSKLDEESRLVILSQNVRFKDERLIYSPCISSKRKEREILPIELSPERVRIDYVTSKERVAEYHSAADVLVCPSLYESVGYVNLEAMATGTPIVASNTCGIPEFVIDESTGLLFAPGDSEDLVKQIIRLREDPELRKNITQKQKEFIVQFEVKNTIRYIKDIYRRRR